MTLKSAKEDLQARTLQAVSGLLARLEYIASLRQQDGSYSHWGLSRVHGEVAAQKALTEAHHGLVSSVLRTPLRKLMDDVKESCNAKNFEEKEFLDKLENHEPSLHPAQAGVGLKRHLSSVLHALAALAKNRQ
jgi:hypothetical protein